jgi:hypothetical protein
MSSQSIHEDIVQRNDIAREEDAREQSPRTPFSQAFKGILLNWYEALKQIFSTYLAVHLAILVTTVFSMLFVLPDFSNKSLHFYTLWRAWQRYDANWFAGIASHGYKDATSTAFFPLYPLLERSLLPFVSSPYIAGLIISNVAGLIMLLVLYRLVREDFDSERALRTVLYISVFPTAFFFAAAYNESLFVCLSLLSFYNMRHGRWWIAGLFGLLASLTRSVGILLLVPFAYEYLYQHQFDVRKFRLNALSGVLIVAGMGLFAAYCYFKFHDVLAFSHAQSHWSRNFAFPGVAYFTTLYYVRANGILSFLGLRNLLDLVIDLFVLVLIVLSFVGPWRLPRNLLSYGLYALVFYVFLQLFPISNPFPLTSVPRFMIEIFPAFIILAGIGKHRGFSLNYLLIACALFFFWLIQFLSGHWIT